MRVSTRWRLGLLTGAAIMLLALLLQLYAFRLRGTEWAGSYLSVHPDEAAYLAYVNALIEGRPRRNDPYTGRDDRPGAPQAESLFSIQFIPPYALALPARILGGSAHTAFILLRCVAAFASALA
ncbi:MAG TPA: hypothetical protein VD966_03685, partial [Pyrinomonadaceae bacterium]|nr:hypothetical protein [Pyrinomonadaceae bacterium]